MGTLLAEWQRMKFNMARTCKSITTHSVSWVCLTWDWERVVFGRRLALRDVLAIAIFNENICFEREIQNICS